MKKFLKIIILIFITILLSYTLYVCIDCIRLKSTKIESKPIITTSIGQTPTGDIYKGLGYSITYYLHKENSANNQITNSIYGAEFRLFDKFLIWAWIE